MDIKRIHVLCYKKGTEPSKDTAPEKQFRTAGRGDLKRLIEGVGDVYDMVFFATVGVGLKVITWQQLWEKTPLSEKEAFDFFD